MPKSVNAKVKVTVMVTAEGGVEYCACYLMGDADVMSKAKRWVLEAGQIPVGQTIVTAEIPVLELPEIESKVGVT